MNEIGNMLPRIISKMEASYRNKGQWYLSKSDIKYSYWLLQVAPNDAWKFSYVLPKFPPEMNTDKSDIVVTRILQMGWSKSPTYFYAA